MQNKVFCKTYAELPPVDKGEVLRYAGYRGAADENFQALLRACMAQTDGAFAYRVCYLVTESEPLREKWGRSQLLSTRLQNAEYALVFAASIGLETDRRILQAEGSNTAKALALQALGTERIESLCDCFCAEIERECAKRGRVTTARFSAGYGDFPLERQREIFALLSPEKYIGLTLNDSLLMTPTKSVTAIVPIGKKEG